MIRVDTDCDIAYERESERLWEEANSCPEIDTYVINNSLNDAWDEVDQALKFLNDAKKEAEGFPICTKISLIISDVETMLGEIETLQNALSKGGAK